MFCVIGGAPLFGPAHDPHRLVSPEGCIELAYAELRHTATPLCTQLCFWLRKTGAPTGGGGTSGAPSDHEEVELICRALFRLFDSPAAVEKLAHDGLLDMAAKVSGTAAASSLPHRC